jgi:hypothetical protein
MDEYRIIGTFDVGRATIDAFGRKWPVVDFIGEIQPRDVGKRIYLRGDILQVENDEQLATRKAATAEQAGKLRTAFDKKIREKLGDKVASKVKFDII